MFHHVHDQVLFLPGFHVNILILYSFYVLVVAMIEINWLEFVDAVTVETQGAYDCHRN